MEFHVYEYEHSNDHMDDGYGVEAATKLGFDEHQVFKTLMADTGAERVVGVVPVSGHMDLKALAAAVGAKKASMADPKVAMRESGYVVGGISPLGRRHVIRLCWMKAPCNSTKFWSPAASEACLWA